MAKARTAAPTLLPIFHLLFLQAKNADAAKGRLIAQRFNSLNILMLHKHSQNYLMVLNREIFFN